MEDVKMKSSMMKALCVVMMLSLSLPIFADTLAYWRFEEGPADAKVAHPEANGVFYPSVADNSGNGNAISAWTEEDWGGSVYKTYVAGGTVNGLTNNYSVKNTGGYPGYFTQTGTALQTITPSAFTIEATFKLENGGYRTIVGRDSRGSATVNGDLAALYLQAVPDNGLAIKFCDVSGYWHEAISDTGAFQSFDFGTDPDGIYTSWYSMAAISDGSTLSLYLRNVTAGTDWVKIADKDMTLSGSPDTRLTAGTGDGGDWDAGNWSVGRGLYAGNHGDRAWGFLDEVRISDAALDLSELLYVVPEPTTLILLGLGGLGLLKRRS